MITGYTIVFIVSCLLLFYSGRWVVESLAGIARFLRLREFVVAFFIFALAGAIPNFFVGISSALKEIPELSFGDIVGGNLFNLTIVVSIAVFLSKGIPAQSRTIQSSSIFTMIVAIVPLLLILDGELGRGDGLILILGFFFYTFWLFSKRERFTKTYEDEKRQSSLKGFRSFSKNLVKVVLGLFVLLIAAQGIVESASFFANYFNFPLGLVGILIVAVGNCLPETYFVIIASKSKQNWMILGDLMGSVIINSTLVLGIVALVHPIRVMDFSPFVMARFFLVISAVLFLFFMRSGKKISQKEAVILFSLYFLFIISQFWLR
jgi:cation:H+ antiporter